jgi:hypothetical protein
MKKLLFVACVLFVMSCNSKDEKTEATSSDTTTASDKMASLTTPPDYPYTLDKGDRDWQPGSKQHAMNVLKKPQGLGDE